MGIRDRGLLLFLGGAEEGLDRERWHVQVPVRRSLWAVKVWISWLVAVMEEGLGGCGIWCLC